VPGRWARIVHDAFLMVTMVQCLRHDRRLGREVGMERTRWEYKIINIRSENYRLDPAYDVQLNELGELGWELVSITSINFKTGATDHIGMVFKRQKT
jgi:hypothetical protein